MSTLFTAISTARFAAAGLLLSGALAPVAAATSVVFDTNLGEIEVDLFEERAPQTVDNFLGYVDRGEYTNTIFHRSAPGFVVQGGGFTPNGEFAADPVAALLARATQAPVANEPGISNTRGTLALAKVGGDPDSGTNQFFFNLADNSGGSAALDTQNGGFTVFGEITSGLEVIDAIAALPTVDLGETTPFTALPTITAVTPETLRAPDLVLIRSITAQRTPVDPIDPVDPVDPITPGTPAAVPSPSALLAGLSGLVLIGVRRRHR